MASKFSAWILTLIFSNLSEGVQSKLIDIKNFISFNFLEIFIFFQNCQKRGVFHFFDILLTIFIFYDFLTNFEKREIPFLFQQTKCLRSFNELSDSVMPPNISCLWHRDRISFQEMFDPNRKVPRKIVRKHFQELQIA